MEYNTFLKYAYSEDMELIGILLDMANYAKDLPNTDKHRIAFHSGVTFFTQNHKEMALLYLPVSRQVVVQLHERGLSVPAMNGLILQRDLHEYYNVVQHSFIREIVVNNAKEDYTKTTIINSDEIPWTRCISSFGIKDDNDEIRLINHISVVNRMGTEVNRYALRKQYSKFINYNGVSFKQRA